MTARRKPVEVALPLDAIKEARCGEVDLTRVSGSVAPLGGRRPFAVRGR